MKPSITTKTNQEPQTVATQNRTAIIKHGFCLETKKFRKNLDRFPNHYVKISSKVVIWLAGFHLLQ